MDATKYESFGRAVLDRVFNLHQDDPVDEVELLQLAVEHGLAVYVQPSGYERRDDRTLTLAPDRDEPEEIGVFRNEPWAR